MRWLRRGQARILSLAIIGALTVSACVTDVERQSRSLEGTAGVYVLTRTADIGPADRTGVDLVVGQYRAKNRQFNQELRSRDMRIMDSTPQRLLYDSVCPSGRNSCRTLDDGDVAALHDRIRGQADVAGSDDLVAAFLVTDDYRKHVADYLPEVADTVREVAPGMPLVCGVAAPLGVFDESGAVNLDSKTISRSVSNFSPRWCDYVLIYSYAPTARTATGRPVVWEMTHLLPYVKDLLRERGWDPMETPIIGGPMAFEYAPRAANPARGVDAIYRGPVTGEGLRRQIEAFCAHGAVGIVAYAWRAPGAGRVSSLADREDLRLGFASGVRTCGFSDG